VDLRRRETGPRRLLYLDAVSRNVLIVEDDPDVRDALTQVLEFEGYGVTGVCNGVEAIESMRSGASPHVILLDLMMPVMDGMQFRSEQLRDPQLANIPVVIISADRKAEQKAESMGVAAYLKKPLEVDNLLDLVARLSEGNGS
jgi:CheY-like chemotaxis protein